MECDGREQERWWEAAGRSWRLCDRSPAGTSRLSTVLRLVLPTPTHPTPRAEVVLLILG